MPLLNGPRVRHLAAAERGWDLSTLAQRSGTHPRTLANATRENSPQGVSLLTVYALGDAIAHGTDLDPREIAASIVSDEKVAAEIRAAKETKKTEPTGPTKRTEQEKTTGPKRPADEHAAVA